MTELQTGRVQQKTFRLDDRPHVLLPSLIDITFKDPRVNIDLVSDDRMAQERKMRPDLMRATGVWDYFQKANGRPRC